MNSKIIRYDDFIRMLKEEYGENLFKNKQYQVYEYCKDIDEVYEIFNDDIPNLDFYNKFPELKEFFNTNHNIYIYTDASIINYRTYERGVWVIKGNELTEFIRTYKGEFFNHNPFIFNFSNHSCYMHRYESPDGDDICIFRDYTKLKQKYLYQKFVNVLNNYRKGYFSKKNQNEYRVLMYASGDRYKGKFQDGKRNGYGVLHYANGDCYKGEFQDDKRNGYGILRYANGDCYKGELQDDKRNGYGILNYIDGERYEGEFKEDNFSE